MIREEEINDMSMLFSMFSDSTRLKIIHVLFDGENNVGDIADKLKMTSSAISHQLSTMKKLKLVKSNKIGKQVYYYLADEHVKTIFLMAYEHIKE